MAATNADLLASAQNLVAALIATGLVESPNIIINGQVVTFPPAAMPLPLRYNDAPPGPAVLLNPQDV